MNTNHLENERAKIYMNSEKYSIVYLKDEEVFIVVDRNLETVGIKTFPVANQAITWAEDFYKALV